ncbi:MAG: hypothetical protein FWC40_03765 [Proteobacteria bacterium]|nr:hypothetical protein [Pseudomonadota bacterium]
MRITTVFAIGLAAICLIACEAQKMCDVAEDCTNLCKTYDNNALVVACYDGNCRCIAEEALRCDETIPCDDVCDVILPGTTGECVNGQCNCIKN